MLRERPPVARVILRGVLAFPERHVGWWLHDLSTMLFCMLEMFIDVFNGDMHVLTHAASGGRVEWSTLPTKHQRTLGNRKLRMPNKATTFGS